LRRPPRKIRETLSASPEAPVLLKQKEQSDWTKREEEEEKDWKKKA
jgi:hypothetical protein